jgi:cellulose synthase/poly-beta-1,6-N-acetylglucosamine synthase-like glycosyltransferase
MTEVLFFSFIVIFVYAILIVWLLLGLKKLKPYEVVSASEFQSFSMVIAFRDESDNLPDLLNSISKLNYPHHQFEVIFVDDDSKDDSIKIIEDFKSKFPKIDIVLISNIRKTKAPKKDAIHSAISISKYDWIYTTDADCVLPENGLEIVSNLIQDKNPVFIAGMVNYQEGNGFLNKFQQYDWLSLNGFTMSGFGRNKPMICSGANLVYRKNNFLELGGFDGNNNVVSGDDVFLLQKFIEQYPHQVTFLNHKDSIVFTKPLTHWKAVVEQHKRWMAKTGYIKNNFIKSIGIVVLFTNISWVILFFASFFNSKNLNYFLFFYFLKLLMDGLYIYLISQKMKQKTNAFFFALSQIIYPFFSIWVVISGFTYGFVWKERKFKK